ncbi:MAG: hypothetical protein AAF399_24050 [Bacteroidota bacterium]
MWERRNALLLFGFIVFVSTIGWSQEITDDRLVTVRPEYDSAASMVISDPALYLEGWDTLPQIRFWRKVISLQPDSSYLSLADTREILHTFSTLGYDSLERDEKRYFKDSLRAHFNLPQEAKIYVTYGKSDFYQLRPVIPSIGKAIPIFTKEGVDPWYAQAILLIESPGRLAESPTGAYGPFQLMRYVAVSQGLTVNRDLDERAVFARAAMASAGYLGRICIPEARKIVARRGLSVSESDIWFRLLVLHIYHAGAGNVSGALRQIPRHITGMELIRILWKTRYRRFGNASQNYSQVALATLLELDRLIAEEYEQICLDQEEESD